ncbi:MAG: MFS transporter [Chloroflexi bacterium]|nr:MFS transporter [Chloroflexota bacterium]
MLAVSTPALGEPGVGVLNAAIGGGILIGSASAIGLAARSRLSPFFILGLVGWGVPIVFIGLLPHPAIAVALLVVLGSANAVLDIAGYTLLQGTVPDTVRAGVLGVLEGLVGAGVAIGGIVGAVLVGQLGLHAALIVTGAVLPVLAVVLWRPLSRLDDQLIVPVSQARLLRGVPMFAPLSLAVTERLAGALVPVRFNGSEQIVREGEDGDAFFLIVEGQVEVTQAGRRLRMMGPGESFGEIALLRGVPRTATVRAASEVQVYRLGCADFLSAITGNAYSATAGDRVVDERIQGPPMITPA